MGDVGCGTGALVDSILAELNPRSIAAIDRAEGFIAEARRRISDSRVRFEVGDATSLAWPSGSCDVTVSGLVLNFVSDTDSMAKEMARVTRTGGKVAACVWDYARGMQMMRHFWDVAVELNPNDSVLDQAERFPLCQPEPLEALFRGAGLTSVSVRRSLSRLSFATSMITGCHFSASKAPPLLTSHLSMKNCAIAYATP